MKMRAWVASVTALLAVTEGICNFLKSPRLIQEANQSWLPLPFSSVVVNLKRSWGTLLKIVLVVALVLDKDLFEYDDENEEEPLDLTSITS